MTALSPGFQAFQKESAQRVDQALKQQLASDNSVTTNKLLEAMRYALFNGGKRMRPMLLYASADCMGIEPSPYLDAAAAAIEMIHAYSLVHDDLPSMDNDDLRRGKPTLHLAFDEATAILAGDALQAKAFQVLSEASDLPAELQLQAIQLLASASGLEGLVKGQILDLQATGKQTLDLPQLERIHQLKTAAIIRASVLLGALPAYSQPNYPKAIDCLSHFSEHLGIAFQIRDDILDAIGDTQTMGKQKGHDQHLDKATYIRLLGLEETFKHLQLHCSQCLEALNYFGSRATLFRQLVDYTANRDL